MKAYCEMNNEKKIVISWTSLDLIKEKNKSC